MTNTPQENGWEKRFDKFDFRWGNPPRKLKSQIKSFFRSEIEKARKEERIKTRRMINNICTRLLREFANTQLDKRETGWDWLLKVRDELYQLLSEEDKDE